MLLVLACFALAALIAWRERSGARARWIESWDERLELRGALVTSSEYRGATGPLAQALRERVLAAWPSALGALRRSPIPFAALGLCAGALALWWGSAPALLAPRSVMPREVTELAQAVAGLHARAARADATMDAGAPARLAARELEPARRLLADAAREPAAAQLVARARAELERLAELGARAGTESAGAGQGAAGRGAQDSSTRATLDPDAAQARGPRRTPSAAVAPSALELELAALWIEHQRTRPADGSHPAR